LPFSGRAVNQSAFNTCNRLLRALSPEDFALLAPYLTLATLELRQSVERPNIPIEHCYFVESGIVSVVANSTRDRSAEVGLVGREGMTGLAIVMGDDRSPNDTYVQIAATGHRLPADRLREAMAASPALQKRLLRYAQAFLIQTVQTALANGTAKIEERLSRWILMSHDRIGHNDLPLTHEFLSIMLAVRRPGVTDALHQLEGRGMIRATRGQITVIDRAGLIRVADGSYGVPEAEYERLLG
jgi:CRP-like cAMP-binding protein